MKILIVSLIYHPGFELADSYLAKELEKNLILHMLLNLIKCII